MSRKAAPKRSAKPPAKPELSSTSLDPDETLSALARTLDFAAPGRFLLAFAKCNLPVQRGALVGRLNVMLEPLNIRLLEVDLTEPVTQILPILRELLGSAYLTVPRPHTLSAEPALALREGADKVALFVYGLEHSLPSSDPKPALLDHLNFSRELFRRDVPCPLVIWLPDYALTKVARGAPDFWAWRSGVYEFPPEPALAQRVMRATVSASSISASNLSVEAKRERLHLLERLLEDYRELGDGKRERSTQADILFKMGSVQQDVGELAAAREHYTEAQILFDRLGDQQGIASSLHQLAMLAQDTGDLAEARRLYEQSLQIKRELGDKQGIASTLHQLAKLAQDTGDLAEARRLYEQSLQINRELGDKQGVAITLAQMALLEEQEDHVSTALSLIRQAEQLFTELGSPMREQALHVRERLEKQSNE